MSHVDGAKARVYSLYFADRPTYDGFADEPPDRAWDGLFRLVAACGALSLTGALLCLPAMYGMSHVACCMLHVACCMWHVACGMWHVACCMQVC